MSAYVTDIGPKGQKLAWGVLHAFAKAHPDIKRTKKSGWLTPRHKELPLVYNWAKLQDDGRITDKEAQDIHAAQTVLDLAFLTNQAIPEPKET